MLESLAAWVLKHYLGKYVENLNTDQLSIGLLQGQVELENLPLKKEALRQVGLPIQIKAGFIGKIKLQIPFRQIRSAPWVIIIEKLYLVAGPVDLSEWDEETEEQALQEQKMHALEALEAQWRANADSQEQSYYASSYSSWMNFGTSVITNIVENLQSFFSFLFGLLIGERFYNEVDFFKLNISDVHFRYEDKLTIPGSCFSSGLTIDSLVAQNCNDKWEPGFASGEIGFKIVELLKFAIYWDDCTPKELLADKEATEFMNNMHKPEYRGHYFLLDHVSGVAHIKRNRSTEPLRSKSTPRIICDVLFDEFPITLSDRQYSQMILWMKGLSVINTRIQNRHLRPQVSAQECPFDWWKYSYEAVLKRIKPNRYSWDIAMERTRDNVAYVDVYQKLLQNPNVALSAEEKLIKERVEFKQSFEELRILREVAMRRTKPVVKAEPPKIVMGNKKNFISAWFPQWWYTTSLQYSNAEEGRALEGEILDVFNNPNDATYLKRDVVFGHFNFSLKEGSVQLRATVNEGKATVFKPLMDLQVEKVLLGFEYRPRSSSYRTTIALGSINLKDLLTKETAFPSLVSPQGKGCPPSSFKGRNVSKLLSHAVVLNPKSSDETLFHLSYEYKPFNSSVDYRIHLRTQSLDIVYNPEAVKWISEFFSKPLQQSNDTSIRSAARQKYQEIKTATKNELIKNWEQILAGDLSNRKTWDIDLDISAPQIIFVEHFCDKNAVMVIVDFGRLHFTNGGDSATGNKRDSDDEEAFQTPCSTPPGSEASPVGSEHLGLKTSSISELSLHEKLYDRYTIELSEMQVLIGEVRDNWKFAHLKGTSVLHVLDRFNISMQVERRLVYTTDPQFPSLTFSGTLPRLVVHISEKKIFALRAMLSMITDQGHSSPFRSPDVSSTDLDNDLKSQATANEDFVDEPLKEMSKLIIMQFTVQQLALEVQSRNRSIAELQVSGVRAACNIRPFDTSVTLSVHSLLLVDALQNFGRDFELLVASHKHVGMDSVSGSMRDSEPTSPVSPASPEPAENPASPVAISQALNTLQNRSSSGYFIPIPVIGKKYFRVISPVQTQNNFFSSPPPQTIAPSGVLTDSEALIMIELTFVSGSCPGHDGQPLQIAAIQFNNLDIIANQETIVELLGFARRVFPPTSSTSVRPTPIDKEVRQMKGGSSERPSVGDDDLLTPCPVPTKIEATFDFHRLNVLLLRAVAKDGVIIGRKICTTTVMQAKIKATVGEDLIVEGSLGGIQVVDLTPEGQKHQRILSLGADPLASDTLLDLSAGLYTYGTPNVNNEKTAFSFSVKRSLRKNIDDCVNVKVRLASVWYTHSPLLVMELQSCATEFKQYLSNLAKSIKSAATEMAIGFVHARAESLAQSLSMSGRLSASLYGSTSEVNSPKRRRKSFTQSVETLGNTPHTPYSPCDDGFFDPIDIHLDVVLDTPVIILPMSPTSDQVFVAHLGKITAKNSYCDGDDAWGSRIEKYFIEIRDMNLYSLTANTQGVTYPINSTGETILPRPDKMYPSCDGKPILHNTVIEIVTERITSTSRWRSWDFDLDSDWEPHYQIQVSGRVIGPLKVSLSREQYKQLLESLDNLIANSSLPPEQEEEAHVKRLDDIQEEGSESITGVSMLSLDPALRARMLNTNPIGLTARQRSPIQKPMLMRVMFGLPEFTIELSCDLGKSMEGGMVSISFRDFVLNYDQTNSYVSYLQMSLKSLVMEDLLVPMDSKNRFLVVSSAAPEPRTPRSAVSQSCPDLSATPIFIPSHQSLPDRLYAQQVYPPPTGRKSVSRSKPIGVSKDDNECPCTPPPSPRNRKSPVTPLNREENLVLINVTMVDKEAPNYSSEYNGMDRLVSVDFNCLDVIANIKSWVVVFDFFGMDKSEVKKNESVVPQNSYNAGVLAEPVVQQKLDINSKLDLEVRSLTLVLIGPEYEVARTNISYLTINTKTSGSQYNWEGRLGSMSLTDLTPHGKLYRERFSTTGNQALHVNYIRYGNGRTEDRLVRSCDSELHLEMSSVVYIHTQRFLGEINAYFLRFSQLQAFVAALRSADKENEKLKPSSRMLIEINAGSPVLLLPLSSSSPLLLVADLGKLTVRNKFRTAGSEGTTSSTPPEGTTTVNCLLDIMSVDLVNMDLFAGRRCNNLILDDANTDAVDFGIVKIIKEGPSLLPDKCHLKLQIDRNLDTHLSREVPDLSVKGTLKKLEASLDLSQYKLIRGLLTYNIGENMQDLYEVNENNDSLGISVPKSITGEPFWLMNSIHLDLVNVVVHLRQKHGEGVSLACINFIKSRLVVETFSDRSQDIDLVSAEILIADTRFQDEPFDKRCNLFTNILQPMGSKSDSKHSKDKMYSLVDPDIRTHEKGKQECDEGSVQAEVHYRRRKDYSKATVLLNNMRLMAVLDWWEIIRDFIVTNAKPVPEEATNDVITQNLNTSFKQTSYISGPVGVVTKCPPIVGCEVIPYEFKLNITDSEIVLLEDTSVADSNAIILKSTTVISYRPEMLEKPLSCNLNHCEVFSCVLGMEEETALSIIDPVTVNMEVTLKPNISEARGISDAMITSADRTLEVQMQHLCVRLSYHDFRMLSQMLESIHRQTYSARTKAYEQESFHSSEVEKQTLKLIGLGFSEEDCAKALEICSGQIDDAALWLTQNAKHVPSEVGDSSSSNSPVSFQTVEVKLSCLSICVIDDCRDADVPLLELSLSQLYLKQEINGPGLAKFLFTSDYYNRVLSGWEPFIEPWRCSVNWKRSSASTISKNWLEIVVTSEELLNINITSTLMELYSMVKDNWTQDYYSPHRIGHGSEDNQKSLSVMPGLRRRSPFVPFALKNDTNSVLWFTVLINTTETISEPVAQEQDESWIKVNPNETVPFTFGGRKKVRHRDTHKVRVHQIAVRVDNWAPAAPVSVDKVGVYFRHAEPMPGAKVALPRARLVFAITLEGSARKLVTVRSALTIKNCLTEAVEAKLENPISYPDVWLPIMCLQIPSNSTISVPLSHALAQIWIRPLNSLNLNRYHAFSSVPLGWNKVENSGEILQTIHRCPSNRDRSYRFVASIRRENFPNSTIGDWPQPAHTITLISPLEIINLLPCDLFYSIKEGIVHGYIKPGLSASIHEVDCDYKFKVNLHIENFPKYGTLLVPSPVSPFSCRIKLHDESGRRLDLNVFVQVNKGAALRISVSAPYWIINRTSFPLVFRQEGTSIDTAGQFEENEIARVVTPLLFSLSDPDASPTVQARVGAVHQHQDKNFQWCQHFHLQGGVQVRRLRVSQRDHRQDIVYLIGIHIRPGKGRYRHTNIVTLSPRFQLHNKSSYQLQFSQKYLATTVNDPGAQATYATAVKDCSLAWHWPKLDEDLFLCVRLLDIKNCLWSGGFRIDNEDSFHINVRDRQSKMYFLRVEVVLRNATYFVVFTNADNMPPPVMINNFSHVPIQFYQSSSSAENFHSTVRPQTSVAYAWDQPVEPPRLTLIAPGGASAEYDINASTDVPINLTYENFIYIAFTATFNHVDGNGSEGNFDPLDVESQQLVLECVDECKVTLNRKQPGARSQLWRMTADGRLEHEGSSPPRDPHSKSAYHNDKVLVLDIAGTAPQPTQCVALVLKRPNERRLSTQTWKFTEDGRLCCSHKNMCVQAKDGFFGLRQGNGKNGTWQKWSEAVLGPGYELVPNAYNKGVPIEQAVSRMKMRPGSGLLSVSVSSDGPTRVLKIVDPKDTKINSSISLVQGKDWSLLPSQRGRVLSESVNCDARELKLKVDLKRGFGISIVSRKPPEELLYLNVKGFFMNINRTASEHKFDCTIEDIQCDNQLFEPQYPVLLYVTRGLREDDLKKKKAAISISAHKLNTGNSNFHNYKHFEVRVKTLSLCIEERLLLKLYAMFGNNADTETEDAEESDFETQRMIMEATSVHATRYYFQKLNIVPSTVRLSFVSSAKLPPHLQALKRKLGLTMIKFEDAAVELKPFIKIHPFETSQFLINSILKHFKEKLKWQAPFILGSVDFLGNPVGFVNDVTEGFSGLLHEGSVGALLKSITHGISNSAAKVTESLSDGLGWVILDDTHEETRQRIRKLQSGSGGEHIVAGLKGLGFGLLGGLTSLFKQTYEGAASDGVQGLISGFGKGLVGTVTKPAIGVLDFATETASAIRDSSRSSIHQAPPRFRLPRCVTGPGGLLPLYSAKQSQGQEFLYMINERNYSELLLTYEILSESQDLRILITSDNIRVITSTVLAHVLEVPLADLYHVEPLSSKDEKTGHMSHYIVLTRREEICTVTGLDATKQPKVLCDSRDIAVNVSKQIKYAKALFKERSKTLISSQEVLDELCKEYI